MYYLQTNQQNSIREKPLGAVITRSIRQVPRGQGYKQISLRTVGNVARELGIEVKVMGLD